MNKNQMAAMMVAAQESQENQPMMMQPMRSVKKIIQLSSALYFQSLFSERFLP